MGKRTIDEDAVVISHVTVLDDLSINAYLAPQTRTFYNTATCLPMDDMNILDVTFHNKDSDFTFVRGETFQLLDKSTASKWFYQVVTSEDADDMFVGRIIPIPPLESYSDNEEAPAKPKLMVVATTDKA